VSRDRSRAAALWSRAVRAHRAFPLLLCALLAACSPAHKRPPLVVLISVDTLRRDALNAFDADAPPLPSLDAFAAESVRFERAASAASWTLPAHGSLLTGLYPDRHGATDPRVALATDVPMLAEQFRAGGYETIGLTHGGYVDRRFGFDRGFDRYVDDPSGFPDTADALHSTFDEAAALVAKRTDPRPLFLFLHTFSVHDYFMLRAFSVAQLAEKPARTATQYAECLQGTIRCTDEDWRVLRDLYAAELRNLDACFARLRAALAKAGLWDDAVVVLTADHGEGFDPEHHRIHHGGRLHEDVIRIPLVLHAPGIAPRAVGAPASLVDVAPTLLELAGLPPLAKADGRSLVGAARGAAEDAAPRPIFAVEHYSAWWGAARTSATEVQARPLAIAAIVGDRWYLRQTGHEMVYDVATDPHQQQDLSASAADLPALRALAAQRDVDRVASPAITRSDELRNRLRALGYGE
jgi:arylsulfatase A-like enzyme